jgi:hypothetical protein
MSLVGGFVGLLLAAAPAAAHGGDPVITVEAAHPDTTAVHFIVKMVWESDGDPIDGKTLTATPTSPDGVAGAPVTLNGSGSGIYQGSVEMPTPGSWTVTIASADPVGSITHTEVRPDPAPTATTSTSGDEATEEQAAGNQDRQADAGGGDSEDDDSDGSAGPIIVGVAIAAVLAGGLFAVRTVRRSSTPSPSA